MKLSVLVPAYNLEHYIQDCLLSLLQQEVDFEFEVLVCDDASTDQTAQRIRELQKQHPVRLKPIFKTQNGGLGQNIQTLLEHANGEYIAYMDGDDLALPGKLQKQVAYLDNTPDCHMVYHESDVFDSDTGETLQLYSRDYYNWSQVPARSQVDHLIRYGLYMQACTVMFRNHPALSQTAPLEYSIALDYPLYVKNALLLNANIDFLPEVLGRYRQHQGSFGAANKQQASRRIAVNDDMERACLWAEQHGASAQSVKQGITHHRYATALNLLFRQAFDLFEQYIELSCEHQWFFNDTHQSAFAMRKQPEALLDKLAKQKTT